MIEKDRKIIFTGPVGAGKSTAIATISDIPPVCTDTQASDAVKNIKPTTTVSMDYGMVYLEDRTKIHLYGTPGQERFDFMWSILTQGGIGLVLLIDNTRAAPFKDLQFFLTAFENFIDSTGLVIGITKNDLRKSPSIDDYYRRLPEKYRDTPVFSIDARLAKDIYILLEALIYKIDASVQYAHDQV